MPDISAESGTVSALRAGDNGERRFLQISSNLNPGNSGGPLVDEEGFAVGVIRMRLLGATGIGFAIPIEQAKDFLERRGLDGLLPARRLRLGAPQAMREKGLGLRLPDGMEDVSPLRARVESDPRASDVALRIDRVLTPLTPAQIEQALVQTQQFEQTPGMAMASRRPDAPRAGPTRLAGRATGGGAGTDQDVGMLYTVLDLGAEALVARYVGPAEQLAFNASVLRDSLASLDGQTLRASAVEPVTALKWESLALGASGGRVAVPAGWVVEPGAPTACQGLKPASAAAAIFAPRDFTLALRVAVLPEGGLTPEAAASVCSSRRGTLGQASYALRAEWMGVQYVIEGVVARVGGQVVQAEVIAAEDRATAARALLAAWVARASN